VRGFSLALVSSRRLPCRVALIHNNGMLLLLLKVLYFTFLVLFFYLHLFFTAVVSFLKVSFFGL